MLLLALGQAANVWPLIVGKASYDRPSTYRQHSDHLPHLSSSNGPSITHNPHNPTDPDQFHQLFMPAQQNTHSLPTSTFPCISRLYLTIPPPRSINPSRTLRTHSPTDTSSGATSHPLVDILHQCISQRIPTWLPQQLIQHSRRIALPYPL